MVLFGLVASKWRPGSRQSTHIRAAAGTAVVCLPIGMLILPVLRPASPAIAVLLLLAFTLVFVAAALRKVERAWVIVMMLSGALIGLILIDLISGCRLLQNGWMSYSAADGSRFYGIGNEYMGAVIGALIVSFALFPSRKASTTAQVESAALSRTPTSGAANTAYFVLFTALILLMAAPFAGAKAGAIPSATAAAAVMLMMDRRGRIIPADLMNAAAVILLILAVTALVDSNGSHSHLIRSFTGDGGDPITTVIRRKLGMELRLLLHSPWTLTLVVSATSLALLGRKSSSNQKQPNSKTILTGLWCGAAACLIFNDAGVLAAAMVMLYGCAWAFTVTGSQMEGKPT
jgi:hypothetical protein